MVSPELAAVRIHPAASVETSRVGRGATIGAYARIGSDVEIGEGAVIGEDTFLNGAVRVGNAVRIGPKCCIDAAEAPTILSQDSTVGAHATIWAGVTVGRGARIEPGSVVTKDVPAMAVVAGNPAQIVHYCAPQIAPARTRSSSGAAGVATEIPGVTLHDLPLHEDLRGNLTFGEAQRHVPFPIKRYFLTFAVTSQEVRGEHAHRRLEQFLVCIHGRVHIAVDDGRDRANFLLDRPNLGVYIPPMIWSVQYRFSADAVLLGLCSDYYEADDYIRDYAEFMELASRRP
jgi:acetyltransferase-like isoleucine patch superfamily enzyme/dTDP-4-dehydrorhamnose 3,5-epimerase-like enzyme